MRLNRTLATLSGKQPKKLFYAGIETTIFHVGMLIIHAGAALKYWLRDFLSSCSRRLKIPMSWIRALVVTIPKPIKPMEDPKSYQPISLLCVSTRSSRGLSTLVSNQFLIHCFLKSRLGFDAGIQPWIKSFC